MSKTYSAYVRVQVPEGYELASPDLRVPTKGECIANQSSRNVFRVQDDAGYSNVNSDYRVIIRPSEIDAPRKAYVEFDIPPGYELAEPRMRPPQRGEYFLGGNDEAVKAIAGWNSLRPILRKVTEPAESPDPSFQKPGEQMSSPATTPERNLQPVLVEIPAGYELACPQMRAPKAGENYLIFEDENREVGCALGNWGVSRQHHRVIVHPAWKWPEWLTAAAIAMDANGSWRAYASPPIRDERIWTTADVEMPLDNQLFRFDPPPCDDWTKSLRLNPNLNR